MLADFEGVYHPQQSRLFGGNEGMNRITTALHLACEIGSIAAGHFLYCTL
jgi:hypothetical protein